GVDREAGRRQDSGERRHIVALEPEPIRELEPACNAALARLGAVVIDHTAAPLAADIAVGAARDQARILHGDHGLIVVAGERPGLDLALGALAAVQEVVERVQPMVPPRADVAQPGLELVGREQLHSSILNPSEAISQPAASTFRRSGEPATRIGLVLLIWI